MPFVQPFTVSHIKIRFGYYTYEQKGGLGMKFNCHVDPNLSEEHVNYGSKK